MSSSNNPPIDAEISATIKLVLSLLEEASKESRLEALDPVVFNERRRTVIRRIWHMARVVSHSDTRLV